jgi:hypothetical protein
MACVDIEEEKAVGSSSLVGITLIVLAVHIVLYRVWNDFLSVK